MRIFLKLCLALLLILLFAVLAGGSALWWGHPDLGFSINGEDVPWQAMGAAQFFGVLIALAVAAFVVLVVIPLVLLLALGLPLLIVGLVVAGVIMAVLGVGAVLSSPLLIVVLLLYLALRPRRRAAAKVPAEPAL